MKLVELRNFFEQELRLIYDVDEVRQHFALLCESYFGYSSAEVVLSLQNKASAADELRFKDDLAQLKENVPIQYLIGKVDFAGVQLKINPSVLIPRPETEELVHWILATVSNTKSIQVLDIGTGSGCIALALKKVRPNWHISAWDIDNNALRIAQQNAKDNALYIDFHCVDTLSEKLPKNNWDIIISNPPYVPAALKQTTQPHVLAHEPHHAIFVPDNRPLYFYEHICDYAMQQLRVSGNLFFEGHAPLMESLKILLQQAGFSDIVLRNDFRTNPRFIRAKKQ